MRGASASVLLLRLKLTGHALDGYTARLIQGRRGLSILTSDYPDVQTRQALLMPTNGMQ